MDSKSQQEEQQWMIDKLIVQRDNAEQQLTEQLQQLQNNAINIEEQTAKINNELVALRQQFDNMQWNYIQRPKFADQWLTTIEEKVTNFSLNKDWPYPVGGFLALLIVIVFVWVIKKPKAKKAHQIEIDENEDEYDFLGSAEGIPAKLDLARAYLAMDDFEAAKEMLADVISQGNPQQVQEAKELLAT